MPEAKKHKFNGSQQTAQIITTQRTSLVTFLFALIVSGRERREQLDLSELLANNEVI